MMSLTVVTLVLVMVHQASGDPYTRYGSSRRSAQSISFPDEEFDRSNRMQGVSLLIQQNITDDSKCHEGNSVS